MKIRITLKDPDALHVAVSEAVDNLPNNQLTPQLLKDVMIEELEIADSRWRRAERRLDDYTEVENCKCLCHVMAGTYNCKHCKEDYLDPNNKQDE